MLCAVLALLMALGPSATIWAQSPRADEASGPLKYVAPGACAVVVLRPKQVFAAEAMRMMPLEVIQAVGIRELGIDPLETEQIVISLAPPQERPPAFAVYAQFAQAYELKGGRLTRHTAPGELNGRTYLKSRQEMLPSFFAPDRTSLLAAPEQILSQLVDAAAENPLAAQVAAAAAGNDLYMWIDVQALRPLIGMALSNKMPPDFPAEARPVLEIPNLLKSMEVTVNLSNLSPSELVVTANSEADARQLETILEQMKDVVQAAMTTKMEQDPELRRMLSSEDPVEQAMGRYLQRMQGEIKESIREFKLVRDGARFKLLQIDPTQAGQQYQLTQYAAIGVLVGLLLPAVQAAREAARRTVATNNVKQIMLALFNYMDAYNSFPAHAIYSSDGKPLLSWRVRILPYLEQQALYNKFHLDEPWDSEHNKSLIPLMPRVYLDPSSPLSIEQGRTHFLGVQGEGMFFDGSSKGCKIRDVRDGTSNSIALLQVNDDRAAVWTKPDDWQWNADDATKDLGGLHPGIFVAGFCDGSVHAISKTIDPRVFKALLTIAGAEVIDANSY
jgi:hypothetical protein